MNAISALFFGVVLGVGVVYVIPVSIAALYSLAEGRRAPSNYWVRWHEDRRPNNAYQTHQRAKIPDAEYWKRHAAAAELEDVKST